MPLIFDNDVIERGDVPWNQRIPVSFWLANHTTEPLTITGVSTSCGCFVVERDAYIRRVLAAGGRLQLTLSFQTEYEGGDKIREATVQCGAYEATARVFATVIRTYELEPARIDFGPYCPRSDVPVFRDVRIDRDDGTGPILVEGESKPPALLAFESARRGLRTADVEWDVVNHRFGALRGQTLYRQSLVANDDVAEWNLGTEDGVVGTVEGTGAPVRDPQNLLVTPDGGWQLFTFQAHAQRWYPEDIGPKVDDIRTLGMLPTRQLPGPPIEEALWTYPPEDETARRYRQTLENGIYVVEMRTGSDVEARWYIDPNKGWNATRCELRNSGKLSAWTDVTLGQFGETWFPECVRWYISKFDEPHTTIRVTAAEFNAPHQPQRLTPEHIGFDNGVTVAVRGDSEHYRWANGTLVTSREFWDMVRERQTEVGPMMRAYLDWLEGYGDNRLRGGVPVSAPVGLATRPVAPAADACVGAWEAYTTEFIERYRLNADQAAQAQRVLRLAQGTAQRYLTRHETELRETDDALASAQDERDQAALEKARQRRAKLVEPIHEIFRKVLQARLARIPTRAQRKGVEPPAVPAGCLDEFWTGPPATSSRPGPAL